MWFTRYCFVIAIGCVMAKEEDKKSRTVNIEQGPIRGYKDPEGGLFVFYNIPYATAPTGKDRFKAPLPPPVWITTREAVDKGVICPQLDISSLGITNKNMPEDCLIANVYVPDTEEKNLPVVVLIHGGFYLIGYGDLCTPKNMVRDKNVIYVSFNYRLGIHGFLCLGTPDAPGNAGMKDIIALLRWVKRNIANFGGNSDDVTIDGFSAGSSAADLLVLSKAAKGLFHKAIPESGVNLSPFSIQPDPIANAKDYAQSDLGFKEVDNIYALEDFYKAIPYQLMYPQGAMLLLRHNFTFTPCVERDTGEEMFLDDSPINILKSGDYIKIPTLNGFSNMEGLLRVDYAYQPYMEGMNNKFSDYLPNDLQFKDEKEKEEVAKITKEFYFGNKKIDQDTIFEFIDYFTDSIFATPHLRSLRLQVEAGNDQIYLYQFSFPSENRVPEGIKVKVLGSNHCGQTMAVLDNWLDGKEVPAERNSDLDQVRNVTRQIWANFIKTGKPVLGSNLPTWPASDQCGAPYMDITNHPQLKGQLLPTRAHFWDQIYQRYYRQPVAPPAPPKKHDNMYYY